MPQALIAPVAGSIASAGASKLFSKGGKKNRRAATTALRDAPIRNISTPGFSTRLSGGGLALQRSAAVDSALGGIGSAARKASSSLGSLSGSVTPGSGGLTNAVTDVFGSARTRLERDADQAVGNLRSNLARRRILGSSFADDSINRRLEVFRQADSELAAQENLARNQSFLQELDLASRLIQDQFAIDVQASNAELDQLNLETQVAANIATGSQSALSGNAQFLAQLEAQRAANKGAFFQPIIDSVGSAVGNAVGGLFGGGSSAAGK